MFVPTRPFPWGTAWMNYFIKANVHRFADLLREILQFPGMCSIDPPERRGIGHRFGSDFQFTNLRLVAPNMSEQSGIDAKLGADFCNDGFGFARQPPIRLMFDGRQVPCIPLPLRQQARFARVSN